MSKRSRLLGAALALLTLLPVSAVLACTAAVISGKATPDGRPILWKQRDTSSDQNCVKYFPGGKYSYVAVVESAAANPKSVWIGTNSAGFSIMNTLSYNMKDENGDTGLGGNNGSLMRKALDVCADLADFERFLDTIAQPRYVSANFGVIDAKGGAAFYEVDDHTYYKYDANDPKTAPFGYIARTNFSFAGQHGEGVGQVRYQQADRMFSVASGTGEITPAWIFDNLSRSYTNPVLGIDLKDGRYNTPNTNGWFVEQDFIARNKSTCSVAVQGVKQGENPQFTTMWTIIGYPPVTPALPVWVKNGDKTMPRTLVRNADKVSPLCDKSVTLKKQVYSYHRGPDPERYFHWELLYNPAGTGMMQRIAPVEKRILDVSEKMLAEWRKKGMIDAKQMETLYLDLDTYTEQQYQALFGL